jgi:DNA-binding response OmpR family regulator
MSNPDKPTVMIVDDEQNFTESLQLAIEDEFTVSVARSLESARQALGRFQPAAILLDLRLPDGDGLELFQDLKKLAELPVVIVMTAYASLESYAKALGEGGVDYLVKPLNIEKLKSELKKNIKNNSGQGRFDDRSTRERKGSNHQ